MDKNNQFSLQDDEKERLLQDEFTAVATTNANSNEASDKISGSPTNSDTSKYYITDYFLFQ
tara:strand:- start:488 stop:670 length:183 start_codon:yes stop_codon:yes gene_type:complete